MPTPRIFQARNELALLPPAPKLLSMIVSCLLTKHRPSHRAGPLSVLAWLILTLRDIQIQNHVPFWFSRLGEALEDP
jgi:hypothetical protein